MQTDATDKLLDATVQGDVTAVRRLLFHGADPTASDEHGFAAIHYACYHGHVQIVHLLVEADPAVLHLLDSTVYSPTVSPSHRKSTRRLSPLIVAAANGHAGIVEFLVESQADVSAAAEGGVTPLIAAASLGHADMVRFLIAAHSPLDHARADGATALVVAAAAGDLDLVRLLHGSGGSIDPSCSPSVIHHAAAGGFADVVRYLLWNGAQHDGLNGRGHSVFCAAACAGHLPVVTALYDFGITPEAVLCRGGATALHCAARARQADMVEHLVLHGASLHSTDCHGVTPLQAAVEGGCPRALRALLAQEMAGAPEEPEAFRQALHAAVQVPQSTAGSTPPEYRTTLLHLACHHGHPDVVLFLLQLGLDGDAGDSFGCTPLRVACNEGHTRIAELLLTAGADLDLADQAGVSPLMAACYYGRQAIVELLLEGGCDVTCRDEHGLLALHHAALNGHLLTARAVLQWAEAAGLPMAVAPPPTAPWPDLDAILAKLSALPEAS